MTETLPDAAGAGALADRLAARLAKAKAHRPTATPAFPPRPADAPPLLSAAQRRLWFLHQWSPESAAYSIPVAWRIRGPLDVDRLIAAVRSVVARNEIVRTRYPVVDGEPTSVVDAAVPVAVPVIEVDGDLSAQLVAWAQLPFRLAEEWPVRATVLRLAADDHVLALCLHHIAADGWSIGLLAGQLSAAYGGAALRDDSGTQYADVTYARREVRHQVDLEYWTRRLADLPAPLELPADRARPAIAGDDGAIMSFEVSARASAAVRSFAAAERATSFMCLTAAFSALCARYTGTEDVVIGTPVAGRDADVADVLGCFVNTLVLRNRITPEVTGRALVRAVRASVLTDTEHTALPYESLVEALPGRSGGSGLFTVQLVATNVPRTPLVLADLDVTDVPIDPGAAKLDLSLAVEDLGGPTMPATLTYRTDIFDPSTVRRFADEFVRLLEGMATRPDARVADIDVLSGADREMVLAAPVVTDAPQRTIVDAAAGHVLRTPGRTAVAAADGTLSYAELDQRANRLASALVAAGVRPQQPVGLDATRDTGFVVGLLGILRAGGAYLPLETDLPAVRRAALLSAAGARHLVGADAPEGVAVVSAGPDIGALPDVGPGDLAYIIFTSGSTGTPKGVAVEHGHLMSYVDSIGQRLALPGSSYAVCSTLAADLGHTMVFGALATGGTLRIIGRDVAVDPRLLAANLRSAPVDVAKLVPSHLSALLASADPGDAADLLPRRCLVLGGEAASWALIDRVRALSPGLRVLNHYGPTETTVGALTFEVGSGYGPARELAGSGYGPARELAGSGYGPARELAGSGYGPARELAGSDRLPTIPLGTALPHLTARIVDSDGRPVSVGVPGELYLGGAAVARGYVGRPEETARRFGPDPTGASPGIRFYRTGDRARWRADATIEFLGRTDRQVKIRGYRVEPGELEGHLRTHPGVRDAAVVVREGRLVAFVTGGPTVAEIDRWSAATLPAHLVPSSVVSLAALPLTPNGKVDRTALPEVDHADALGPAPRSAMELLVAGVFAEVLGQPVRGVDDDFFALGGHSLLATQAVSRLRRAADVALSLPVFFAHPTVGALAGVLETTAGTAAIAGRERTGPVPGAPPSMSDAQRRMWFLDQAVPGNPAYNLPYVIRLDCETGHGDIDHRALSDALNGVVARHDALRTTFATVAGEPVPAIAEHMRIEVARVDLRNADEQAVRREVDAEFQRAFDLATGPLVRARLLHTSDPTYLLLLTMHHIVFDGWSLPVLLEELAAGYRGRPVAAPRITYADYARWQATADHRVDLDYWADQLGDAPMRLDLPAVRPRPPRPSYQGGAVFLSFDQDTIARLTELARAEGATPFMVLFAAYQVLLARYAGVADLIVGTPVAGRDHPDLEPLVGLFVNMLALRGRPERDLSFRAFLRQTRQTTLEALAHAGVAFERVVEHLRPERDPSRAPIFSTMMSLRNTRQPAWDVPGVRMSEQDGPAGVAKYDLSLVLAEVAGTGELRGALEYSTDLFDRDTAQRMVDAYQALLAGIVADPDAELGDLPLLDDDERHRILVEWNDTSSPGPYPAVSDLVAAQARRRPEAVCLVDDDRAYTYRELDEQANRLAHRLRALGAEPGSLVALSAARSARVPIAMLGVLRAGCAYVPLDAAQPAARRDDMLADSGAAVLITDEPGLTFAGPVLDIADPCAGEGSDDPGRPIDPDSLAYVIYTSGSTGRPKGVMVEHRNLANVIAAAGGEFRVGPNDVWLALAPFSFDMSALDVWLPLTVGARLVVAAPTTARDGTLLAQRLREVGATYLQGTPTTWRLLVDSGWAGDAGLTALAGGEALPPELARDLLSRVRTLWNEYGPTETTIYTTLKRVTGLPVTAGRPLANNTAYVLDERLRPVPVGVTGELYHGGVQVTRGYHNQPELTRERYLSDPYSPAGGRLYRTGDLARWRPDGELEILGRADTQVKLRGYRIEIGEIEAALASHRGLSASIVDLRPDAAGQPQLVAYIVGDATAIDLRAWLADRLPAYMVPSVFVPVPALPLSPNGKVDRASLPDPASVSSRPPTTTGTEPLTATEARIAAAFARVLEHHDFGPDDDFFAVGGESMRAVRAVRLLDDTLSVLDLFTHPTVRGLGAYLDRGRKSDASLLHRLTPPRVASVNLVCAPFGGGGAIAYADLASHAPDGWSVYALQPPGRDPARPDEALIGLAELADACAERVLAEVSGPIVVYGHCVGSALAISLARRLEAAGRDVLGVVVAASFPTTRLPGMLDVLARLAPGRRQSNRAIADSLRLLGGVGEDLPSDHRAQLARAVRHDARQGELFWTAEYAGDGPQPLATPLLVVVAADDRVTEFHAERAHDWSAFGSSVDVEVLDHGGHFFQRAAAAPVLMEALANRVDRWLTGASPVRPPVVPPETRLRAFGVVTFGQLVSLIGSGLSTFALGVWAYQTTGAVSAFAAIAAFGLLPAVLAAPVAGAVADRYDRRIVMMWCDAVGVVASVLLVSLLWTHLLVVWHLYAMVVLTSLAVTFRQPAYLAAVAQLAPKRYLGQANGVIGLGTATGAMVAQLFGGILTVAVGLTGVAWIDLVSYGVALVTLSAVRFPDLAFVKRDGPLLREIWAGWQFLASRRALVALTVFFAIANALGGVVVVLVTPLVLTSASPAVLGLVLAANGAGLLAGSALMAVWGGTRRRSAGMIGFVGLFGVSAVVIGLRPDAVFPAAGMFGIGVCAALINAHWLALVQVKVGADLLGRILATCLMFARTVMPFGYLISGPLVDSYFEPAMARPGFLHDVLGPVIGTGPSSGIAAAIICTGLVALAWTVAGYRYRPLREADGDLPDAVDVLPVAVSGHRPVGGSAVRLDSLGAQ